MRGTFENLPDDYVVHRIGETYLVLDRSMAPELVPLGLAAPEKRAEWFAGAPVRGRGATPAIPIRSGVRMILRRYRHGGLLSQLTGSLYIGPERALSELRVTARAASLGAPVPRVLCLVLWPVLGPFWSGLIGTREESGARDLLGAARTVEPAKARAELALDAGRAIRKLHDAGVDHPDLQVRNVLSQDDNGKRRIVVIDLDRAAYYTSGGLPIRRRAANLGRLLRSVVKTGLWPERIGETESAAFLEGYIDGDRDLRDALRGWLRRERLKLRLHTWRYRWLRTPAF